MEFKLTKEQRRLKKDVHCFAQEQLKDEALAQREKNHQFSQALWDKCGEQRIQGLHVPEAYGGMAYDGIQMALAMEAMGKGCDDAGLLVSLTTQMFGGAAPLMAFGTESQKSQFLPGLADGSLIATSAIQEADAGSDYDNLATTAVSDGDSFIINGEKSSLINGPIANLALVYAVTDSEKGFEGGVTCFLVDTLASGVNSEETPDTSGYRTASIGRLTFTDVKVPAQAVLGSVGSGAEVYNAGVAWERGILSAMHVGRMEHLLDKAILHARTQKSNGLPVGKKQSVSHKVTDMKIRFEVARLLSYKAAWSFENNKEVASNASIAKLFATDSRVQSELDAAQIFGGLFGGTAGRSIQEANEATLYAGTAAAQRNTIAKSMGLI